MNPIKSQITINAPLQEVWLVLSDFDNYHTWNPFTPKVEFQPQGTNNIMLHVRLNPNGEANSPNLRKQQ